LVFDAWEHAFYLQYKNVKADFAAALRDVVNWDDVASRFAAATAEAIQSSSTPGRDLAMLVERRLCWAL
jgi:hypothetical protein